MKTKKWILKSLLFLVPFLIICVFSLTYISWKNNYRERIYPNISVASINLSGENFEGAFAILNKKTDAILADGLDFRYGSKSINIDPTSSSFDSDLSYPALIFNNTDSVNEALAFSHPDTFWHYLIFRLKFAVNKSLLPHYTIDEEEFKILLNETFSELNIPSTNASFSVSTNGGELVTLSEKLGKEINYDLLFSELKTNLDSLNTNPITIKTRTRYPSVKASDLSALASEAKQMVGQEKLDLTYSEPTSASSTTKTWSIKPAKLLSWISIKELNGVISLSLDQEKIKEYLKINVSPEIDLEVVRPRFIINNGKVDNWQAGTDGRQVNLDLSAEKITKAFLSGQRVVPIVVNDLSVEKLNSDATLNIKEIIGTGQSDFSGSTSNRRKNIQVGAAAVNGVLLAPGEEFSLVKTLGDVSQKTGYLPELVIKGNKTVPEYGGGLCQIATTVFRAALASGLPITERRNHSYRVSYYEPAGTDAAVYIPNPDVKFINDSANYVLIQSRISGNMAYFDFWGTKDGRVATTTTPVIYNIVKPAPAKIIETTDLLPGQKKCTEKAHNGADTYFDYKVIYPEGATSTPILEKRFSSHYVPWQEVCLVGVSAKSASSTAPTEIKASSSPVTSTSTNP